MKADFCLSLRSDGGADADWPLRRHCLRGRPSFIRAPLGVVCFRATFPKPWMQFS